MKTDGIPIFKPKILKAPLDQKKDVVSKVKDQGIKKESSPDFKLELSAPPLPSLPSMPTPSSVSPKVPEKVPDHNKEVAKNVSKEVVTKEVKKISPLKDEKHSIKKDLLVFIKGLDLFSSPLKSESGYAGLDRLAGSYKNAKVFKWNEQDSIMNEISKIHPDHKVVLVGHSLGGDSAVEITNALDTLENSFRKVDLLVTIDAIGFNNDIIPQNVGKHLNIFGESNVLLNDGPHVARDTQKTDVKNILSDKGHTELDDDKSLQFEIVNLINETLKT